MLFISTEGGLMQSETPLVDLPPLPKSSHAQQFVRECAAAKPNALAISADDRQLTFSQLWQWSANVAHCLSGLSVAPDVVVGVLLDRSPEAIAATLGILRAGGAFLPLDPALPSERLRFVLRDSGVRQVITSASLASRLADSGVEVVDIGSVLSQPACSDLVDCPVSPANLAYVIYTSGSTGEPKGVEITHAGLTNLIRWHCCNFHVTAADRAAHMATISFDAAVWEIWPYLAAGASIHIPDASIRSNPELVRDWIVAEGVTIAFLPTASAEKAMALDWPSSTCLRVLLTGADTLYQRPPASLPFAVVNNYGPTECTVVATSGTVLPAELEPGVPPIGRPIDGIDIHILDPQAQAVAAGEAGELYLGGAGLARGYRNRPDLTAQKFINNPLRGTSDRLYRTGDLVRLRPDGQLEFLGRTDEQVKIRGHRVEPSEVVRALLAHPGIESAAVIAKDAAGEKRLYAYIQRAPGQDLRLDNLFEHLRGSLPEYMLPAGFIAVDSLPIGTNGKLDRSALPEPSSANLLRDEDFASPSTVIEGRVAAVLGELLRLENVGRTDNFFLLGGHSLLGTQLITRVDEIFGVQLSLLNLFDHPTVEGIAAEIENHILAKLEAEGQCVTLGPELDASGQEQPS
jgi:amino acid adenylation domain-containing protein